ncbi:CAMK family protein kinase [Tritrichomonas foetus]|uniref:CAMK family protein kinase n=1 Tax=Tritrichomonas foetus TaxID=1144522 RepID=A0A1J4JD65_9EUKA|nr:CAMK family protein kinase [Tritrichomonas foetus]|eukprot:OHS95220.1 CAMK family protein kinase [Tritrichomonas foetus]
MSCLKKLKRINSYKISKLFDMCDSNIPIPDFDFDDYEMMSFDVPIKGSPQCRIPCDIKEIAEYFGFKLASDGPIKGTSNSNVYEACSINTTHKCALKVCAHKYRITKEFENFQQLPSSTYIVQSYDLFEYENLILLQMELCDGDIYGVMLDEPAVWHLIYDVASALDVIHSSDFIHLDVSPSNILSKGDGFKLADFGTLIESGTFEPGDEGAGPYASPEVLYYPGNQITGYHAVTPAADIFSLGVVLLEVCSGIFAPRGGNPKYD